MKFLSDPIKQSFRRAKDFCVYKVLHADDPPHRLALGIAVGFFVTFTPLIGFQMVVSVFLAWIMKANKLVGVPIVWISNPVTIIPIYYPCYWIGCKLLGMPAVVEEWKQINLQWDTLLLDPATGWGDKVRFWWDSLLTFMGPLWLGCIIVATVVGILSYYISLYAIRSYRLRRWGQLMPPKLTPTQTIEDTQVAGRRSAGGGNAA
jgi:uncharacterized protein (DUF2062 family)